MTTADYLLEARTVSNEIEQLKEQLHKADSKQRPKLLRKLKKKHKELEDLKSKL